jgi:hypothetical protein
MITLHNLATNTSLGTITEADLRVLIDALEEESAEDRDYFIDEPTVELLAERGASPELVTLLRGAIGSSEGVEIRWDRGRG